MTLTSTNHGLSYRPFPHVPKDQRLAPPCCTQNNADATPVPVSGCFNDATNTSDAYKAAYGHAGIDYALWINSPVFAMYGGVVTHADQSVASDPVRGLGIYVEIESCTNEENNSGFVHRYCHLSSIPQNIKDLVGTGQLVEKGALIGSSGNTTFPAGIEIDTHLHVEVLPFNDSGRPTAEDYPSSDNIVPNGIYPGVADRIRGCMNFASFIDPCEGTPQISIYDRQILTPRAHQAAIPVYEAPYGRRLMQTDDNSLEVMIQGTAIGSYAILESSHIGPSRWYEIRLWDGRTGWIQHTGEILNQDVVWVHVQDAPVRAPRNLSVSRNGNSVVLTWDAPTRGATVTGYQIRRGVRAWYQSPVDGRIMPANTRTWTDDDPPPGYSSYSVAAFAGYVQGPMSNIETVNVDLAAQASMEVQFSQQILTGLRTPNRGAPSTDFVVQPGTIYVLPGLLLDDWLLLGTPVPDQNGASGASDAAGASGVSGQSGEVVGWVPRTAMQVQGNLDDVPRPPFARVEGSNSVPVRIGPSLGYTEYVTRVSRPGGWYAISGRNDAWWQLQVDADTAGWVQAGQVETTGDTLG